MTLLKFVTVTRKGQVTIPYDIRKKLGIVEGSKLLVESVNKKIVIMEKVDLIESWDELIRYARKLAKEKGLTQQEIEKDMERIRKRRWKEKYGKCHG